MKLLFIFFGILFVQLFVCVQVFSQRWWQISDQDTLIIEMLTIVNSAQNDYSPLYLEEVLYFTSDRKNKETDEQYLQNNEDIYCSKYQNFVWSEPKKQYFFNTDDHTALAGFSYNGAKLFTYKTFGNGDFYVSYKKNGKWTRPIKMKYPVTTQYHEQSISESKDNIIILSSDRSRKNHDIFQCFVDKKGKYVACLPIDGLNTEFNEIDVSFSPDGKILYFSSNRPGGFGGYDIYYSVYDSLLKIWSLPKNLWQVNSSFDDRGFHSYDSLFFFDSNRGGNFDIYWGRVVPKKISSLQKVDSLLINSVLQDSVLNVTNIVNNKDSIFNFSHQTSSEYVYKIQVGAYYKRCTSIRDFRYYFPAFDTTAIYVEKVIYNNKLMYKYLIDQVFLDINVAEQRRKIAVWQQNHPINTGIYTLADAFIVVFNKEGKRVMIYFSYPDKYILLNN